MKILSFSAIKGGVGKTTLAYNYGEWLAKMSYRVLFIDLDHQCNLSQIYNILEAKETVANIFTREEPAEDLRIHQIKKNIDLIAGNLQLDDIEKRLETNPSKDMLLYMWLEDNYNTKNLEQYDFIIIDCHPDFSTATRNAVIVSHALLSPIIPSEHGYQAKFNIEHRLEKLKKETFDYKTRESFVTAKLFFLGNMIKHNTLSSRELVNDLKDDKSVIAMIPHKELFNRSTLDKRSIAEFKEDNVIYNRYHTFFDEMDAIFRNMTDTILKIED